MFDSSTLNLTPDTDPSAVNLREWMPFSQQPAPRAKLDELTQRIQNMPKAYDQNGKGDEAIAYLHYSAPAGDFYITEKDSELEQLRAYGLIDLGVPEMGHISIVDLVRHGFELDLYFTPKTLREIRAERAR